MGSNYEDESVFRAMCKLEFPIRSYSYLFGIFVWNNQSYLIFEARLLGFLSSLGLDSNFGLLLTTRIVHLLAISNSPFDNKMVSSLPKKNEQYGTKEYWYDDDIDFSFQIYHDS